MNPAAICALLPPGLAPDEKSNVRASFWFLDWQFTGSSIYQTRTFSAPSAAAGPLTRGSRVGASVAAHGERLATARLQLEEQVTDPSTVFNRPTVMRRYFPQLAADRQSRLPVDELTMSLTDDLAVVNVWSGTAELQIPEARGEELHLIAPLRVGRGHRLGMAYSVTELRILENYARQI